MRSYLLETILVIPGILIAFVIQGYAKALVADRLGDKTPRFQGRLTLIPLAHIDLLGFIMILLVKFGWTKPVEVNPSALKRGRKDEIKVTIAGPIGNLIVAFILLFIYGIWRNALINILPVSMYIIGLTMLDFAVRININLFIFNLIPMPGLAGFDLFRELSPKNFYKYASKLYEYQMPILLGVVLLGQYILIYPSRFIYMIFSIILNPIMSILF